MFFRILCTAVASLFAILAFCGFGPMPKSRGSHLVWTRISLDRFSHLAILAIHRR